MYELIMSPCVWPVAIHEMEPLTWATAVLIAGTGLSI